MTNQDKLVSAFSKALMISPAEVDDTLAYDSISQWDSVAHMALVAELESVFAVMLDTDEIIAMNSVGATRAILVRHGVVF